METIAGVAIILIMIGGALKLFSDTDKELQEVAPVGYDHIYKEMGTRFGVDWRLLKAIAIVESSENPKAKNPTDPSCGLMQVLCVPDGQGGCKNRFNVLGWPPESENKLFDPSYNVYIASQILRWNIGRYGFLRGIAVYNRWASRLDPESGPFGNQSYVDKVVTNYRGLGGSIPA